MGLIFMFAPIVISIGVLIFAMKKGFNKTALYLSAAVAMVAAMFIMKYNGTWYGFFCALTIPFAATYVLICLFLSIQEDRERKKEGR